MIGHERLSRDAVVVKAPDWLASFRSQSADAHNHRRVEPSGDTGVEMVGPLHVYHSGSCETATFGRAGSAGAVIFEGYLFDRDSLVAELGLNLRDSSTAAIIGAAYQAWGVEIFTKLDGCYAIAIWDSIAGRLFLAHDALGRHPVFYASTPDGLWFAPDILTLISSGRISTRPNRLSFALAMLLYWPEAGETYLEGVHRIRPGHYLEVTPQAAVTERQYWHPIPADEEPWLDDAQAHDQFEPALMGAVARCMQLRPQGIMLSGGVDSVTVAALATQYTTSIGGRVLTAVSGRTGNTLSAEEIMQSKVTEALRMPHCISTLPEWKQGCDDVTLSLRVTPDLPSPTHIWWVGAYTNFYRRTAAQQLSVLLTGAGGDNWLGVADAHAADLLRQARLTELMRFMKADMATGGASLGRSARRLLWAGGIRPHLDSLAARWLPDCKMQYHRRRWHQRLPAWFCPDDLLRAELIEHLLRRRTASVAADGHAPRNYYRHSLRALINPYMHHENETAFHIEHRCGLRLLSPYHDKRLVEFLNRIAPRVLVCGDRYKGLLRPVVAKHLPGLGLENQRKDYRADENHRRLLGLRDSMTRPWERGDLSGLGRLGILDPVRTKRQLGETADKGYEQLAQMFAILSSAEWLRRRTAI